MHSLFNNRVLLGIILVFSIYLNAQVGLNTQTPNGALDINFTDSGVLLPRVALSSLTDNTTVINPQGGSLINGTMVYDTGVGGLIEGIYIWQDSSWSKLTTNNEKQVHFGTLIITSAGLVIETGIDFSPSSIEFIAINRVQDINDGFYRSGDNNSNDVRMAAGFTTGYAQNNDGVISQFAMGTGINGSSINNIGTYSSSNHCFAAIFTNNDGEPIHNNGSDSGGSDSQQGLIRASLNSFDEGGFTINVDRFLAGSNSNNRQNQIAVVYKAYR